MVKTAGNSRMRWFSIKICCLSWHIWRVFAAYACPSPPSFRPLSPFAPGRDGTAVSRRETPSITCDAWKPLLHPPAIGSLAIGQASSTRVLRRVVLWVPDANGRAYRAQLIDECRRLVQLTRGEEAITAGFARLVFRTEG